MKKYNKLFIEHTAYCRSSKCDTPCEGQSMPTNTVLSTEKVSEILHLLDKNFEMFDTNVKIILYGQGSSNYPYNLMKFPTDKKISIETTICDDYQKYYDMLKNTPVRSFARVYSSVDIKEAIKYDYAGYYFVVNNRSYKEYAEMMGIGETKIMPIPLNEATDYTTYDKLVKTFKLDELERVKHHHDKIMVITDLVEKHRRKALLRRKVFNPAKASVLFLNK